MKKIAAYTLMEVTVAMLLSAIVISICYTAYGIIGSYYADFRNKNETADAILGIRHAMEKDFLRSRYILKTADGIAIEQDSLPLIYVFKDSLILRKLAEQHTDTFNLQPKELKFFFEGNEVIDADTIDQVNFDLIISRNQTVPIQLTKFYSAKDLFQ
jgi:type II secretory pathway component PulJ